jgi:hypothetical protein
MTIQQVSVAVPAGQRLSVPPDAPAEFSEIMRACWKTETHLRPTFESILQIISSSTSLADDAANLRRNSADDHTYLDLTQGCYDAPRLMTRAESLEFRANRTRSNSENISGRGSRVDVITPSSPRRFTTLQSETTLVPQYATLQPISVDDDVPSSSLSSEITLPSRSSTGDATREDVIESMV